MPCPRARPSWWPRELTSAAPAEESGWTKHHMRRLSTLARGHGEQRGEQARHARAAHPLPPTTACVPRGRVPARTWHAQHIGWCTATSPRASPRAPRHTTSHHTTPRLAQARHTRHVPHLPAAKDGAKAIATPPLPPMHLLIATLAARGGTPQGTPQATTDQTRSWPGPHPEAAWAHLAPPAPPTL